MEPERFAAELIRRLEGVLKEREAQEKLEERLKRVQLVCSLCFLKKRILLKEQSEAVFCYFCLIYMNKKHPLAVSTEVQAQWNHVFTE